MWDRKGSTSGPTPWQIYDDDDDDDGDGHDDGYDGDDDDNDDDDDEIAMKHHYLVCVNPLLNYKKTNKSSRQSHTIQGCW